VQKRAFVFKALASITLCQLGIESTNISGISEFENYFWHAFISCIFPPKLQPGSEALLPFKSFLHPTNQV
jgi:hypothetical protein